MVLLSGTGALQMREEITLRVSFQVSSRTLWKTCRYFQKTQGSGEQKALSCTTLATFCQVITFKLHCLLGGLILESHWGTLMEKKETYEAFLKVLNPVTYSFSVFGWLGYEDSNEKEWRGDSSTYSAFPIPAVSSLGLIQWSVNIQAGRVDLSRTMGERLEGLREVVSFCSFRVSRLPWTRVRKK